MIREAPLPDGWPGMTKIGEVEIKEYPLYRAAFVTDADYPSAQGPMFMALFDHISRNEIAMTTPVEMGYDVSDAFDGEMSSMAFIYREPTWGSTGTDGKVKVRDIQPQTMASIGVRGDYTDKRFVENLDRLGAWLADRSDQFRVIGPPRYLGYNGPMTLPFMRYGEVQVPVTVLQGSTN